MSKKLLADPKIAELIAKSEAKAVKEERARILAIIKEKKDANKTNEDKMEKRIINFTLTNLSAVIKEPVATATIQ